jgi:hypothetical protein
MFKPDESISLDRQPCLSWSGVSFLLTCCLLFFLVAPRQAISQNAIQEPSQSIDGVEDFIVEFGGESVLDSPIQTLDHSDDATTPTPTAEEKASAAKLNQFMTRMVLEHLPHEFEEDKDWGMQDERWDGLHIRRDGLKIKTKRRKKLVNHGTWKKYSAQLIDPQRRFSLAIKNTRATEDGKVAFDIQVSAKLKIHGRQSKWIKGVQLYSVSVDGHADVQLLASVELGTSLDITKFPPDLIFDPKITDAEIELHEFRIDRVSKAGGEFSQQLSKNVQSILERKIDEKEAKLIEKINSKIDKSRDKLKLSIHDALKSKWIDTAKELMPPDVKEAFDESDEE